MKEKIVFCFLMIAGFLMAGAQSNPVNVTLTIGDPAPPLEVVKWLKGTPVERFEKGHIYVIEFWATWCGPCNQAMPHLSELARQYRDEATFIGVSVREGDKKPVSDAAAMQRFVDKKGDKMDYIVAMDDPANNKVFNKWLGAAGLGSIPATFVIGRDGRIAWIGHPMRLDTVLNELVHTPEKFDRNLAKIQNEQNVHEASLSKSIMGPLKEKNYGLAWKAAQERVKENPSFETDNFNNFQMIAIARLNYNSEDAVAWINKKVKDTAFLRQMGYKDKELETGRENMLNMFASTATTQKGLALEVYYFAAERLKAAAQKAPSNYYWWYSLASAYADLTEFDNAISAQQKAIEAINNSVRKATPDSKDIFENTAKYMTQLLEEYKSLQKKKAALAK